jgi:hypothetical protein
VIGSPQPAMSNADAITANRRIVFLILYTPSLRPYTATRP